MNDLSEYSLAALAFIANGTNGRVSTQELDAHFGHARVRDLSSKKLIEPADYSDAPGRLFHPSAWRLTTAGWDALKLHQDAVEKERRAEADKNREKAANDAKAEIQQHKSFRNDLKVAAFTVALTLLIEHGAEVFQFLKGAVEAVRAFFSE